MFRVTPEIVFSNFLIIKEKAKLWGLELNNEKCELFFCNGLVDPTIVNEFETIAPGIRVVKDDELELLGSPLLENGMEDYGNSQIYYMRQT